MRLRKILAILFAFAVVVAACGDDDATSADENETTTTAGPDDPTENEPETTDGETDPDGTIRVAWITPPRSLDPHVECHIGCRPYWLPVFETLYDIDENAAIVPLVASDLPEYSDDGLTVTIPIVEGRSFHDGTPINADAVVASIDRAMTLEESTAASNLDIVTGVEAVDEYTVAVTLSQARPGFEALLTGGAGAIISPAAIDAGVDLNLEPGDAGSGPFLVDSFVPDDRAVYVSAGSYDLVPERGRVGRLEIHGVPEVTTGISATQAGDFDLAYGSAMDKATQDALTDAGLNVIQTEALNIQAILLRITKQPLDQLEVRQALAYGLDRELINETLYEGACQPTSQAFSPKLPAAVPDYDPYEFDPEQAIALLDEAGLADGFDLEVVTVSGNPTSENNALAAQQMWADIGVNVTITPMSSPDGAAAFSRDEIMARSTVLSFRSDSLGTMQNLFLAGGTNHMAVPEDEPLEELLEELGNTPPAEQDAVLQEMGKYITDQVFAVPICVQSQFWAATDQVVGADDMLYTTYGVFDPRALGVLAAGA